MSIKDFLLQPNDSCRSILSIGAPGSGKSFTMLKCLEVFWLSKNTFSEIHLILPVYEYEQNDSYKFLSEYKGKTKIYIYNRYHTKITQKLIDKQKKCKDKNSRIFLGIDDSTHQTTALYTCNNLVEIATTSRHLKIHSWVILHYNKHVIPPKVRTNVAYVFVFRLNSKGLEDIYENYIDLPNDFKKKNDFIDYMNNLYNTDEHACLLLDQIRHRYNPNVCKWYQ